MTVKLDVMTAAPSRVGRDFTRIAVAERHQGIVIDSNGEAYMTEPPEERILRLRKQLQSLQEREINR